MEGERERLSKKIRTSALPVDTLAAILVLPFEIEQGSDERISITQLPMAVSSNSPTL